MTESIRLTASIRIIDFGKKQQAIFKNRLGLIEPICYRCEQPLFLGDRTIAKGGGKIIKYYHLDCWESMFV